MYNTVGMRQSSNAPSSSQWMTALHVAPCALPSAPLKYGAVLIIAACVMQADDKLEASGGFFDGETLVHPDCRLYLDKRCAGSLSWPHSVVFLAAPYHLLTPLLSLPPPLPHPPCPTPPALPLLLLQLCRGRLHVGGGLLVRRGGSGAHGLLLLQVSMFRGVGPEVGCVRGGLGGWEGWEGQSCVVHLQRALRVFGLGGAELCCPPPEGS